MRKADLYVVLIAANILALAGLMTHAAWRRQADAPQLASLSRTVRELQLTDLCVFTEARYTRHPSLADLHSPFQEHPVSLEHYPSGSLVAPNRSAHDTLARPTAQHP